MTASINIVDLDPRLNKQLAEDFPSQTNGFVQVGSSKYLMPVKYRHYASDFLNFKLRPDDVWVLTFPRSGTTVMQELLWLLVNGLDYKRAADETIKTRSRFLEFGCLLSEEYERAMQEEVRGDREKEENVVRLCSSRVPLINADPSPRVIKSHLPLSLLPPDLLDTCKVVYVARNPRDVANSYYHFNKEFARFGYTGDFPKYWDYFSQGHVIYGPHNQHIREAWKQKNHPNMLFLFYENFLTDVQGSIQKITSHVGQQIKREDIEQLQQHLNVENFRKNKSIFDPNENKEFPGLPNVIRKNFIRNGKNNGWQERFTSELKTKADRWIDETYNTLPADFHFPTV